ncbi:MAG: nucleotidyltransferase domain-containing protein [Fimbriimonadales bacterium]
MATLTSSQIETVRRLAKVHGVVNVRLFGSYSRGSATERSDVDILARFPKTATILDVIAFKQALEDELRLSVDVVDETGLSPILAPRILAEAISL